MPTPYLLQSDSSRAARFTCNYNDDFYTNTHYGGLSDS